MGAARLALVATLMAFPVHAAQPEATEPVSLDQLMTTLRRVRHVEARYIERRTLHALRTPIETRGTLRFEAPDELEKASDPTPKGAADRLTIERGGAVPVVLMLDEHPEIGALVDSIRATLSGDGAALRRSFDITLSGSVGHWQLVLRPHAPAQRAVLQWMRVSGYAERVTAIDTQDSDGDRSEMTIVERAP